MAESNACVKPGTILGVNERDAAPDPAYEAALRGAGLSPTLTTVLVAGYIGDYEAYQGIGAPGWVATNGHRIGFDEACCHFPGGQLERGKYRD